MFTCNKIKGEGRPEVKIVHGTVYFTNILVNRGLILTFFIKLLQLANIFHIEVFI